MHVFNLTNYFRQGNKEIDFIKIDKEILPIEVTSAKEIDKEKLKKL